MQDEAEQLLDGLQVHFGRLRRSGAVGIEDIVAECEDILAELRELVGTLSL